MYPIKRQLQQGTLHIRNVHLIFYPQVFSSGGAGHSHEFFFQKLSLLFLKANYIFRSTYRESSFYADANKIELFLCKQPFFRVKAELVLAFFR